MRNKLSLGLVAVACVALLASGAMGGSVFFSEALGVGDGATPTTDGLVMPNTTLTLGIWASDDQDYDTTIGMNVVSSNPTSVALVGGEVANPDIFSYALGAPVDNRWQDASVGAVSTGQVSNMNAARVTSGTGILASNDGTVAPFQNWDTLYDMDAGAFLLGTVTVQNVDGWSARSNLTINQEGTALFVNGGEQVFPEFVPMTVVGFIPEPSTVALVAFGLIAMIGYGLKREQRELDSDFKALGRFARQLTIGWAGLPTICDAQKKAG